MSQTWQSRVRAAMKRKGLTQADVAAALGDVERSAVGHWLTGHHDIKMGVFLRLCALLDLDPQETWFGVPREKTTTLDEIAAQIADLKQQLAPSRPPKSATR